MTRIWTRFRWLFRLWVLLAATIFGACVTSACDGRNEIKLAYDCCSERTSRYDSIISLTRSDEKIGMTESSFLFVKVGEFLAADTGAKFGKAVSTDYRATFFEAHPEIEGQAVVHHAVEQQTLTRYPGVVTEEEIHSLENLRGMMPNPNFDLKKDWPIFHRIAELVFGVTILLFRPN